MFFSKHAKPSANQLKMSCLEYTQNLSDNMRCFPNNVHHCKACLYFTTSFFTMVHHVKRHRLPFLNVNCENSELETYHCLDCNFQTDLTVLFKRHIKEHVKKQNEDSSHKKFTINNYVCKKCDFETNFSMKWLQHTTACSRKNKKPELVHSRKNDKNKRKKGKQQTSMKDYITTERDEKRVTWYVCKKCQYKAKYRANVQRHVNTHHLDEKNINWFKCEKCSYKSKYRHNLVNHINAHHLDKHDITWYKCEKCSYKTKGSSNLTRHIIARHSDDKDIKWYECQECSYKAKHNAHLKQHVIAHHTDEKDIKWFECKKCPYKAKRKAHLERHMKARHSSEEN